MANSSSWGERPGPGGAGPQAPRQGNQTRSPVLPIRGPLLFVPPPLPRRETELTKPTEFITDILSSHFSLRRHL